MLFFSFREQFLIDREVEIFEHVEDDAFDACVPGEKIAHSLHGDLGGAVVREAEHAGGDAAEGDRFAMPLHCHRDWRADAASSLSVQLWSSVMLGGALGYIPVSPNNL